MATGTDKADEKQSHDGRRDNRHREANVYGERSGTESIRPTAYHTLTHARKGEGTAQRTHESGRSANRQGERMYEYRESGHKEERYRHRDKVEESGQEEYVKCCVMS